MAAKSEQSTHQAQLSFKIMVTLKGEIIITISLVGSNPNPVSNSITKVSWY